MNVSTESFKLCDFLVFCMKIRKNDKVLLIGPENSRFIVTVDKKEFSSKYGQISLGKLIGRDYGFKIKTHIGKGFIVLEPRFSDLLGRAKRGPQAVLLKDAMAILAYTSIDKDSSVVDAGLGSGWLASFLARYVKKVISYERRKEFVKIAKKNIDFFNIKNIKVKEKDVYNGISEKNLDLITLDLPEPWKVPNISKNLKSGGYIVAYLPTINQVIEFRKHLEEDKNLMIEKVIDISEEYWIVSKKVVRPESQTLGHTAFLVFVRKISK